MLAISCANLNYLTGAALIAAALTACDGKRGRRVRDDFCTIGTGQFQAGESPAANPCLTCQPEVTPNAYSSVADGTSCGTRSWCHEGSCDQGCWLNGATFVPEGAVNPDNPCERCDSSVSTTTYSPSPAATSCGTASWCTERGCQVGCWIDGAFWEDGVRDQVNPCLACDAQRAPNNPVPMANGTTCGEAQYCQAGVCADGCWIDGAFVEPNKVDRSNPCNICDITRSRTAWSPQVDGTACNADAYCQAGACLSGCLIEGTFVADGTIRPDNACQRCAVRTSSTAWSNLPDETVCGDAGCSACLDGACMPARLSTEGGHSYLTVADGSVYWGDRGTGNVSNTTHIFSVPEAGGDTVVHGTGMGWPVTIAKVGDDLYVADDKLKRVKPDNTTEVVVDATAWYSVIGLAFDSTGKWLYAADSGTGGDTFNGKISRFNVETAALEVLYNQPASSPFHLFIDGDNVYYTDRVKNVVAVMSPTTTSQVLWSGGPNDIPRAIVTDGNRIYFCTGAGSVYAMNKNGTGRVLLADGLPEPNDLALSDGMLYIATWNRGLGSSGGGIYRVPVLGGDVVLLPGLPGSYYSVAAGEECMFASVFGASATVLRYDK